MTLTIYRHPEAGASGAPAPQTLDIPDLRIVPLESLVLHEHADSKRVARLESRVRADGFFKNPPVVAPIPDTDRYVVLDGANRTSAAARLGCPHLLVQVVDYTSSSVQLFTWHHLITGRSPQTFLREIAAVDGLVLVPAPLHTARQALQGRAVLAYIVLPHTAPEEESPVFLVDGTPGTDHHGTVTSTALLNAMVDTYKRDPQVAIHRVNTDMLEDLVSYYDEVSGLVVFPPYTPDDILRLARTGVNVPAGITRHIISHRALRVNVPLDVLMSGESLEAKNAWWHEQVKQKLAANGIRFYQESTFLFDE